MPRMSTKIINVPPSGTTITILLLFESREPSQIIECGFSDGLVRLTPLVSALTRYPNDIPLRQPHCEEQVGVSSVGAHTDSSISFLGNV